MEFVTSNLCKNIFLLVYTIIVIIILQIYAIIVFIYSNLWDPGISTSTDEFYP